MSDEVYYKLYRTGEGVTVVCMQWFDEKDYDADRFIRDPEGDGEDVLTFGAEDLAVRHLLKNFAPVDVAPKYRVAASVDDQIKKARANPHDSVWMDLWRVFLRVSDVIPEDLASELEEAIDAIPDKMQPKPIAEAPKDRDVLAWCPGRRCKSDWFIVCWDSDYNWWAVREDGEPGVFVSPTVYVELPGLPAERKEGSG